MKKIMFLLVVLTQISFLHAQDITDGVLFGSERLDGTARFVSMGGAFGALGADLSAIKINPAGSSVFLGDQVSFSLDLNSLENKAVYGGSEAVKKHGNLGMNQVGTVFVFNNYNEATSLSRISFSVGYDRINYFRDRMTAEGITDESISNWFLNMAQGVPLDYFTPRRGETSDDLYSYLGSTDFSDLGFRNSHMQTAYLGYETFIFDALDDSNMENTDYISNVSGSSFGHKYSQGSRGRNSKITSNLGMAFEDKYFFGLNLNSHIMEYDRSVLLRENISGESKINQIDFINDLNTKGTGFSMQLGSIVRINDMFRVGLSYESPTWYTVSDQTVQFLRTDGPEFGEAIISPNVINVYPDYKLRTPSKWTGSVAAVFGGKGLLSLDYSYKDFANTKFRSRGFEDVNQDIENRLQAVSTLNLGGEYRLKNWSLRAGYRYQGSPYKDKTMGDLNGVSAGLGYDFGGFRIDFAFDRSQRDYQQNLLYTGFSQQAAVKNTLSNYFVTLVFPM